MGTSNPETIRNELLARVHDELWLRYSSANSDAQRWFKVEGMTHDEATQKYLDRMRPVALEIRDRVVEINSNLAHLEDKSFDPYRYLGDLYAASSIILEAVAEENFWVQDPNDKVQLPF